MKKFFSLLFTFLTILCNNSLLLAQTANESWTTPLHIEASLGTSTPYKSIMPLSTLIDLNYSIKRFSIHALIDGNYFLPKEGMTKNYNKTVNLGGGIGFELFPQEKKDRSVYEIRASVTRSLGSADYKNTAYKVGIHLFGKSKKRNITPSIGAGYCLRSFSDKDFHTYSGMYLSLGLRF